MPSLLVKETVDAVGDTYPHRKSRNTIVTIHEFLAAAVVALKQGHLTIRRDQQQEGDALKTFGITLEKSKETKGTFRFDSPDPNAPITSVYMRKSAFDAGAVPTRIVLTVQEEA